MTHNAKRTLYWFMEGSPMRAEAEKVLDILLSVDDSLEIATYNGTVIYTANDIGSIAVGSVEYRNLHEDWVKEYPERVIH